MRALLIASFTLLLFACSDEAIEVKESINKVSIEPLSELLSELTIYRSARVISLHDSVLSAEINTHVDAVLKDVGDIVEEGAPLIELDCSDEQSRLLQSQSQLSASKASAKLSLMDYRRAQKLFKEKNISKQEFDRLQSENVRSKANLEGATAALQLAESASKKCIIRSPFKAVVTERMAMLGQFVTQGTPLVRLVDAANLEVSVSLTSDDAKSLAESQRMFFLHNNEEFPLALRVITPVVDSVSRSQEVRLVFTGKSPIPGSSGELVWTHPLPILPSEYLSNRDGVYGVFTLDQQGENSTVKLISIDNVKVGQAIPIEYSANLTAETPIVVDGRFGLIEGDSVEVIQP